MLGSVPAYRTAESPVDLLDHHQATLLRSVEFQLRRGQPLQSFWIVGA